jgi:uncharacterized membrane protein YgcG
MDDSRLWDQSGRLSSRRRADLESRLAAAERRLGSPIFVLVVDGLRNETAAALGARTFAGRRLGRDDRANPVLLVVAVRDRATAVETGKGNAGIVPEVDAQRITKSLETDLSAGALEQGLARAIDEIVSSAEATADRRRPSPAADDEPASAADLEGPTDAARSEPDGGVAAAATDAKENKPRGRSRMPFAAAIAVLLLLALALRRRRAVTGTHEDPPRPDPRRPKNKR